MSTPSSPPQDVPTPRSFEELTQNNHAPSHGAHRLSFRGLNHGDGILASPREVVGNLLSSNLSGSPLSRAGYGTRHNNLIILAHLTIPCPDSFNTAITFIQLLLHPDRPLSRTRKMILGRIPCNCRTWPSPLQKLVTPRPHLMNGPLATVQGLKHQECLPPCPSTSLLPETSLPPSNLCDLKLSAQI